MHGSTATHPLFPIGTEWIVALSELERTVQVFDAGTLRRLFTGSYIAPKKYRKRDPREWSDRTFEKLLNQHDLSTEATSEGCRSRRLCRSRVTSTPTS